MGKFFEATLAYLTPAFWKATRIMLPLAVVFLVFGLIAAFFAFGADAAYSWEGARVLFAVFLILAALCYVGHEYGRRGSF